MKLVFFGVIARLFSGSASQRVGAPLDQRIADIARRGGDYYN